MAASNRSDSTGTGITLENVGNVVTELDRVKNLQDSNAFLAQEVVSFIVSSIEEAKSELNGGRPTSEVLESLRMKLSSADCREKAGTVQKAYHAGLAKLRKTIEKNLCLNIDGLKSTGEIDKDCLNMEIAHHLCRRGAFKTCEMFTKAAGISLPEELWAPLRDVHVALKALEARNVGPAQQWLDCKGEKMEVNAKNALDLQLTRLQFVVLLKESRQEALALARARFPKFIEDGQIADVLHLLGALSWSGWLEKSPYAGLLSPSLWNMAASTLVTEACRVDGLPAEDLISVITSAGTIAAPTLIKMASVMRSTHCRWDDLKDLPIEVPLPPQLTFHSTFSCPVSKEQASPENPPVLLRCGHVICRNSMENIVMSNDRFKCPTCPVYQSPKDTKELHM